MAADAGGLSEVVSDGISGFLCPVGDVDAMADAGIRLLTDDALWQRMSTAAAADARARFSEAAIVAQYEALYRRALAAPGRPTPAGLAARPPAAPSASPSPATA